MKRRSTNKSRNTRSAQASGSARPPSGRPLDITKGWMVAALVGLTYLLSLPMFEPASVGLLAYVAFVPWVVAVCLAARPWWVYVATYLLGAAFFLTHFRWLYATTGTGYVLGSLYLAIWFPIAAWPIRHLYRNRGLALTIVLPVVWTAVELARSRGPLNFPWFLVGHSQIRLLTMIQIADLTGAFGVSFVVMMVNGWLADRLLSSLQRRRAAGGGARRVSPLATVAMLLVLGATIIYGRYRLSYTGATPGPRVAVLQGDYLLSTTGQPDEGSFWNRRPKDDKIDSLLRDSRFLRYGDLEADKRLTYVDLIDKAGQSAPDMLVLPETPWALYLNPELWELPGSPIFNQFPKRMQEAYQWRADLGRLQNHQFLDLAKSLGSYIVVGSLSEEKQPKGSYPAEKKYNSAFLYTPEGKLDQRRYDKIHLVLFGEYVPFRWTPRLFWLYRFLNDGPWNPWGEGGYEYSLIPGKEYTTFPMRSRSAGGREFHFGVTICYEDVIPQVFRGFVVDDQGAKRVDFMVNISNDGWFGHGSQQAQHLANCAFRAVENRVAVARAANTGVSGFIRSDGSWYSLVGDSSNEPRVGGTGYQIAQLPVDPRVTFYSRYGDVFPLTCAGLACLALLDALARRMRDRHRRSAAKVESR